MKLFNKKQKQKQEIETIKLCDDEIKMIETIKTFNNEYNELVKKGGDSILIGFYKNEEIILELPITNSEIITQSIIFFIDKIKNQYMNDKEEMKKEMKKEMKNIHIEL